ncbi:hypothetical protein V1524DRAFT_444084, partial [Lipomyces starkeyi]
MFSSGTSPRFIHSGAYLSSNDSYSGNGCECDNDDRFGDPNLESNELELRKKRRHCKHYPSFSCAEDPPKPVYTCRSRIAISNLINKPLPTSTVPTRQLDSSRSKLAILKVIEGPVTPPISTPPSPSPMRSHLNSTALFRQIRMSDKVEVASRDLQALETRSEFTTKNSTSPSTPSNTAITNLPRSKRQILGHTTDVSHEVNYASRRRLMHSLSGSAA